MTINKFRFALELEDISQKTLDMIRVRFTEANEFFGRKVIEVDFLEKHVVITISDYAGIVSQGLTDEQIENWKRLGDDSMVKMLTALKAKDGDVSGNAKTHPPLRESKPIPPYQSTSVF